MFEDFHIVCLFLFCVRSGVAARSYVAPLNVTKFLVVLYFGICHRCHNVFPSYLLRDGTFSGYDHTVRFRIKPLPRCLNPGIYFTSVEYSVLSQLHLFLHMFSFSQPIVCAVHVTTDRIPWRASVYVTQKGSFSMHPPFHKHPTPCCAAPDLRHPSHTLRTALHNLFGRSSESRNFESALAERAYQILYLREVQEHNACFLHWVGTSF